MAKMSAEEKRRWFEESVRAGGSVLHGGRLITSLAALPSLGALASTEEERARALDDISERRRALELEEARLRGLAEGLQQPNASGSQGRTAESKAGGSDADELPTDYPGRAVLAGTGYTTLTAVNGLSEEELTAISGITPAIVGKIMKLRAK